MSSSKQEEAAAAATAPKTKDEVVESDKSTWPKHRYKQGTIPEDDAYLPSRLLFFWARPLFQRAYYLSKKGQALEHDDLLPLPPQDLASRVGTVFEESWAADLQKEENQKESLTADANNAGKEKKKGQDTKHMRKALAAVVGRPFLLAGLIKLINTCLQFSYPILLQQILAFIEDTQSGAISLNSSGGDRYRGYWLSCILFACMFAKAMTENAYFNRTYRAGYQSRVAVSVAVYNKALRLANAERQSTTLGELINLMQVDATKIEMFIPQVHVLWDGILQICGYMVILYTLIGWPCFVGLVVMAAAGPLQGIIMKRLFGLNYQYSRLTDTRVKTTNEAIQGIQSVKMFCWEDSFEKEINKSRNKELGLLKSVAYLRGFSTAYMTALPNIVAVICFVVYTFAYDGASNNASVLFAALAAFDQLRFPLLFYPVAFAALAQAGTSAARVENYLNMKEVGKGEYTGGGHYIREDAAVPHDNETGQAGEIIVKDATIYWNDPSTPIAEFSDDDVTSVASSTDIKSTKDTATEVEDGLPRRYPKAILNNVNLHVKPGELCAVVGRVASGKSTLCAAVLNEAILPEGEIVMKGSVAYVAQTAWILNATLRDNILFGKPYDKEKYERIIKACQLTYDIELLSNGDQTEIGERGINISGGQRQRVSVARAAYSDADIIILDDPLSALDPEVGKRLFEECIVGLMGGKTRLFVTNQIQFLQKCDRIVALGHRRVLEQGSFFELTERDDSEMKRILDDDKASRHREGGSSMTPTKKDKTAELLEAKVDVPVKAEKVEEKNLISKEERNIGAVEFQVYKKYLVSGGGYLKFFFVLMAFLLCSLIQISSTAWVSFWTSDVGYVRFGPGFYLGIYAAIAIGLGCCTYVRTFMLVRFGVNASAKLHESLLYSIMAAPQSFFDTTPVGRILSRFSKDFYSIDIEVSDNLSFFLSMVLSVILSIGSILFVTPWFGIAVLPLGFFYITILNYFRNVSRETKRLESLSRSPVYAHFSETLGGLTTIRAYGQATRFHDEFDKKSDENIRAYYCIKTADRWLSVRLEAIGATIAGLAAIFACNVVISASVSGRSSDQAFASLAGLSISFAISITGMLNWW
ncbi:hypothetical protein MPSEU_001072200 [Mayamaea pseudoterrestris]|nr:hypothetical protein MPSEU_001072200 [Mayamaea pseudoterrestris]